MTQQGILPSLARYAASARHRPPLTLGTRYDSTGKFLIEPGNTVVCHVKEGSQTQTVFATLRASMMDLPYASSALTFTPVSSYHMTLFQGVIDTRRTYVYWPEGRSVDMPIDDVTTLYAERLRSFQPLTPFAIRPLELTPAGVTVCAATKADEAALRDWRDRLSATFGFRHPDHDDYVFHVTFAYFIEWLPDEVIPDWNRYLLEARDQLQRETPILELTPPQFCTFETMEHFQPVVTLTG